MEEDWNDSMNPFSEDVDQENFQEVSLSNDAENIVVKKDEKDVSKEENNHTEDNTSEDSTIEDASREVETSDGQVENEYKSHLIAQVLELQHTLDDLSQRVDNVKEENTKLKSENQVLGQYIDNLMTASNVFQKTGTAKPIKSPTGKRN